MKHIIVVILNDKLRKYRCSCPHNITDLVFLEIEKTYKREYDAACEQKGQDNINRIIGKWIKDEWGLQNIGRCDTPVSELITSYEMHSN